jgi:hypothetical protein
MSQHEYEPRPAQLKWLLNSDPAIRWQVMRDLIDEDAETIAAERSRVATEGWGAKLIAMQSPAGTWGRPKDDPGLLITLYSLVVLMDLGLDPTSRHARKVIERVDKQLRFKWHNNRHFFEGETEPCINGRILALGAYFKKPNDSLANRLLGQQLEDGGWNCEAVEPSTKRPLSRRSSFHTTICVLEGLLAYERSGQYFDQHWKSGSVQVVGRGRIDECSGRRPDQEVGALMCADTVRIGAESASCSSPNTTSRNVFMSAISASFGA